MKFFLPALTFLAATALTGCAGFQTTASSIAPAPAAAALSGSVHGGQQPVTGSHVYLFVLGLTGYGSAATNIVSATGAAGSDTYGNYVTTDATGSFTLANYTCPKNDNQSYLLAVGGNPGYAGSVNNTAITLLAGLGKCGNIVNLPNAVINEVSTVAFVTATQGFMVDFTHIGSSSTNKTGPINAANLAQDLAPVANGQASTVNAAGTAVTPQAKINSLANSLAPCVNDQTPTDPDCTSLFAAATPSGGSAPTDVATAMFNIATHPTLQPATIYNLATPAAPFAPTLSAAPNDWALPIVFTGSGLASPQNVVIDATGNAWIANCPSCNSAAGTESIVEISPAGAFLSGASGYTTGIHKPTGLAIDNSGNLWATELASGSTADQIIQLSSTGTVNFTYADTSLKSPQGIAIDSSNNAWITNQSKSTVEQILANGTRTLAPITHSGFTFPTGIGIDGSGYIFAAGTGSNNILKLTGTGAFSNLITAGNLKQPTGISIDNNDYIYTVDNNGSALSIVNGSNLTGNSYFVGIDNAYVIAIDGASSAWIADSVSTSNDLGNLIHVNTSGALIGMEAGLQDASMVSTTADAVDASGNLWATSPATGAVTLFVGAATPVVTPIAAGTTNNTLGTRP